jgi:hypothetical protein
MAVSSGSVLAFVMGKEDTVVVSLKLAPFRLTLMRRFGYNVRKGFGPEWIGRVPKSSRVCLW